VADVVADDVIDEDSGQQDADNGVKEQPIVGSLADVGPEQLLDGVDKELQQ
jgi:hypothetical protein